MNKEIKNKSIGKIKKTGFTLVETLVAISILSLSILGTFTAVQNGLQSSSFAKDQITAFYLVQETMEYIRNVRDSNAIVSLDYLSKGGSRIGWLTGLSDTASDPCYFGKECTIDVSTKSVTSCSGAFSTCPVLTQDPASGLFGYNAGWTPTRFTRGVQFTQINANEVMVTIDISWTSGAFNKSFQVKQLLFNTQ